MSTIEKTFSDGEVIIKEGDEGKTFFQLLEGKAKVYKDYEEDNQVEIATLEQGQYFGEMAVIEEDAPRSSTIVAEGDVKVLEIPAADLNDYISQNPDKIIDIMKLLGTRIKTMDDAYAEAKKVRDELRKAQSDSRYDGFWARQQRLSIWMTPKNARLEEPSAEALRAAAATVKAEKTETYNYGTIIFKQGEIGKCMYIVHEGNVGVYSNYGEKDELKLTSVDPVACFGEMGMLSDEPRVATAVADCSGTQVEIIYADDLANIFKTQPEKIDMILKTLSYRLRKITYEYFKACQEITEKEKERDSRRR